MDEKNAAINTSEILNGNSVGNQPGAVREQAMGDALNLGECKGRSSATACADKAPYSDFRLVLGCVRTRGTAILGLEVCL